MVCQAGKCCVAKGVPQQARAKLGTLELGRFIAASLVALFHASWAVGQLGAHPRPAPGGLLALLPLPAIQYFFVLSGFVMLHAHRDDIGHPYATLRFWWRRACRIYPAYWLALAGAMLLWHAALRPALLAPLVTLWPGAHDEWVAPAWTLRYEIGFYLLFGLCLLPGLARWVLGLWALAILARLAWPAGLGPQAAGGLFTSTDLLFFGGLLAAWLYHRHNLRPPACLVLLGLGIAFTLPGALASFGNAPLDKALKAGCAAIGFGGVILGLAGLERCGALRTGQLALWLGQLSYPLYILHMVILALLLAWGKGRLRLGAAAQPWALLAVILLLYALCAAATFWFDQPVQRWLRGRKNCPRR